MFPDLDYTRLKKSFEYFVEHYPSAERSAPAHPAVDVAIVNFVECTQDFCAERVTEIDHDLQKRNAYTLSFLRNYFTRRSKGINENEFQH
jgi:hypothetical protein